MKITLLIVVASASSVVLCGQVVSPSQEAHGDEPGEFTADRPGFGVPTNVLPRGVVQFENGFTFASESDRSTQCHTLTWGSPLARVGIGKRTEIRFGGDGFLSSSTVGEAYQDRAQGWSDFGLGAKIALFQGHGVWPALSLIPTLSLPLGGAAFSSSALDPGLVVAWSTNLPSKFSAGGTIGYASISDSAGRLAQRTQAVSLGHALFAGLSGYGEVYNVSTGARAGGATWMFNGGVTHAVGRNAAVDVELGRKFVSSTASWFVSMGFAIRTTALRHLIPSPGESGGGRG